MTINRPTRPDALRTPSQVRLRRWRRRALYIAIALAGAVPVVVLGIGVVSRVFTFVAGGGEGAEPALIASREAVPDSIVRLARDAGTLQPHERVVLVFIKADRTFPDVLLMTDSAIIRSTRRGVVRRSLAASDLNLQPLPRGTVGGLFIVTQRGMAPDTFYSDLNGREGFLLMQEFIGLQRARRAGDSAR